MQGPAAQTGGKKMDMSFGIPAFYTGFGLMGIVSSLIFLVVIGMFIFIAAKGISQWNKNNHSPRLTVPATVVAKRTNVSRHHHHNNMHHTTHSTTYYVTFQVQSGDRMELHVTGQEYGLLVEGDQGSLSFQGTRYLGLERD
jgi:hypothetical protein